MTRWILCLAQGFGLGRFPVAPGTVGSLAGILWFLFLVSTGQLWILLAGIILSVAAAIWICGAAETILKHKDPASVVLDEIVALPVVFLPWTLRSFFTQGSLPPVETFFLSWHWLATLVLFLLFRLFDITKPWPVRQSQHLPAGWGIVADDLLAALYVALLSLIMVA